MLKPDPRLAAQVRDVSENPLAKPASAKLLSDDPQMETRILENSINKICSLLAVGFGDAGAEVIANNIRYWVCCLCHDDNVMQVRWQQKQSRP